MKGIYKKNYIYSYDKWRQKYNNENKIEYPLFRKTEQERLNEMNACTFIKTKQLNELQINKTYWF